MLNKHDRPAESLTDVEEFFFLLLHAQDVGGVSLYKRNRFSSSFTISEWKERFIRKSLPTLILASAFTEKEKIFFFFYILRVEGEFH